MLVAIYEFIGRPADAAARDEQQAQKVSQQRASGDNTPPSDPPL
jgi:hypothetical protein